MGMPWRIMPPNWVRGLDDGDAVPEDSQIVGAREAGRAAPHHGHAPRRRRAHPPQHPVHIGIALDAGRVARLKHAVHERCNPLDTVALRQEALERTNLDGLVDGSTSARVLTGRGTNPPAHTEAKGLGARAT